MKCFLLIIFISLLQQNYARCAGLNSDTWIYNPMDYPADIESVVITGGVSQDIEVNVSLSKRFSGIAAGLLLNGVSVIAGKSAAGAAWQTSYIISAPDSQDVYVFNQAAGNSTPFSWGFTNFFSKIPSVNLVITNWTPLYADHYHPDGDFGESIALCPGYGYTSVAVDEGSGRIDLSKMAVSTGYVIKIKNTYTHKAMVNQTWDWFTLEQAFYMDRQVAKDRNLNAYLGYSSDGINTQIYKVFLGGPDYSVPSNIVYEAETIPNKSYKIRPGLRYVVFVWNISGKEIGVAIDMPETPPSSFSGAHLNMERTAYGSDPDNYSNGNISFHPWIVDLHGTITFSQGETNDYFLNYYVGTPEQLSELGYGTKTSDPVSSSTIFADNFNCTGSGGNINFEYNTSGRQSGNAAPLFYNQPEIGFTVTNAGPNAGKANVITGAGQVRYLNLAHNLTESAGFSVEYEFTRLSPDGGTWGSIAIGTDAVYQYPHQGVAGLEIRLWNHGWMWVHLNGVQLLNKQFPELAVSSSQTLKVKLVVSQTDFSGSGDGQIAMFINDKAYPMQITGGEKYTITNPGGFTNNYINFIVAETDANIDNLNVMTPASNAITTAAWTGDADSGIFYTNTYTHTVNLADTADVVINSQTFTGAGIAAMSGSSWELRTADGNALNSFTGANPNVTPASKNILTNFLYPASGNNAASLTLTGLINGQEYILTLYSMGFEGAGGRRSYIATSDGTFITEVDQDEFGANNGQLLTYRYTANADGVFSISTTPINNPWHFYAFSNKKVIPIPEPVFIGFIFLSVITLTKRKL